MILNGLAILTTLALSLSQVLAADQQPLFETKRSNGLRSSAATDIQDNHANSARRSRSRSRSLETFDGFLQVGQDIEFEMKTAFFGSSVSLSDDGTVVAIGGPEKDYVNAQGKIRSGNNGGVVKVLKYTTASSDWVQLGSDLHDGAVSETVRKRYFGQSVAITGDGDTVAIGIPSAQAFVDGVLDGATGAVEIYKFNATLGDWEQRGTTIFGTSMSQFGSSVAITGDGNTVAIGAPDAVVNNTEVGFAVVHTWNGTDWSQQGDYVAQGRSPKDRCGYSVDISTDGTTVAVGAPGMSAFDNSTQGITRVYELSAGGGAWVKKGMDLVGEGSSDESGYSVSLSKGSGNRVAIGAPFNYNFGDTSVSTMSDSGHVRVFEYGSDSVWTPLGSPITGIDAKGLFGSSVSLSDNGNRLAIGAHEADLSRIDEGILYVYDLSDTGTDSTWTLFGEAVPGQSAQDKFGTAVSLSGDGTHVVGGATWHDYSNSTSGTDSNILNRNDGQARVFKLEDLPDIPTDTPGAGGDPHFRSVNGHSFSFHGQCDIVLMRSLGFSSGLDLEVHIRTTRIDSPRVSYSYISGAAVGFGNDVLETMADGTLIVNGKEPFTSTEEQEQEQTFVFDDMSVVKSFTGLKQKIIVYNVYIGEESVSGGSFIQIRVNTKVEMIFVDAVGVFSDTTGLLGSSEGLFARDGVTDMAGRWNSLGEEWQVQAQEPKLFLDKNRAPQNPVGCSYEQTKETVGRRRLLDTAPEVDIGTARKVCSKLRGDMKDFCITDVLITGDIELPNDPFYNH